MTGANLHIELQVTRTLLMTIMVRAGPTALATGVSTPASNIAWLQLGMSMFGGLALFLGGLELLSEGLKQAAGKALKTVLEKLTVNRFLGAITGAFVTGILNSSSVTTVLVVGFVTAGVMTLAQSVGVIMGANVGSTVTAQLLAFDLSAYALIPVAVGFFMTFAGRIERAKQLGMIVMGLGLVFYGMGLMSDGMKPLRGFQPFLDILAQMESPLLGILAGAVFTGLVQSSAATVGISIALASEGLLTLPAGIALALGANIGTCATALLAALGKPVEAVRASVVHVSFNVLGVVVWLPFLSLLTNLAVDLSPVAALLDGKAKLAAEVPRQIANANTLFNVFNTLLFIGFTPLFARMAERLVRDRPVLEGAIIQPQFLDQAALKAPSVALENVRREIHRVGGIALETMDRLADALTSRNTEMLEEIARRAEEIGILDMAILSYLGELRQSMLTEEAAGELEALMTAQVNLEGLSDVLVTEIVNIARTALQRDYDRASDDTQYMVQGLWASTRRALELSVQAIGRNDQRAAQDVLQMKDEIRDRADALFSRHAKRLSAADPRYLERVRLLLSLVEQLRHMYTLTKRIARTHLPPEVAREST